MCGRYSLHAHPDVVRLQFGLDSVPDFQPHYNIAPQTEVLCIRKNLATFARWGLRGKFVNLRAETATSKFRASGRCLVPASGFYEWQSTAGRRQPYYFFAAEDPLLGFAALWERDSCTLITTDAEGAVRKVHDRMPLIVAKEDYAAWLSGEKNVLEKKTELRSHPVSLAVNTAANDSPRLIEPVELAPGLFD